MKSKTSSLRKFFSRLFVILTAFFVVLSPIIIIEEAHHDCTHEDCQICEVIHTVENNLKHTIKTNTDAHVVCLIATSFAIVFCLLAISIDIDFKSLVTLKIKMTN